MDENDDDDTDDEDVADEGEQNCLLPILLVAECVGLTLCMMGFVSNNDVSKIPEADPDDEADDMG